MFSRVRVEKNFECTIVVNLLEIEFEDDVGAKKFVMAEGFGVIDIRSSDGDTDIAKVVAGFAGDSNHSVVGLSTDFEFGVNSTPRYSHRFTLRSRAEGSTVPVVDLDLA